MTTGFGVNRRGLGGIGRLIGNKAGNPGASMCCIFLSFQISEVAPPKEEQPQDLKIKKLSQYLLE